jgi:hypothetical protein
MDGFLDGWIFGLEGAHLPPMTAKGGLRDFAIQTIKDE